MTKVAHLADLHLGYSHLLARSSESRNQRQVDFEEAALGVARYLAQSKPDVCLVAGDLLHDTNMYPAALAGAVRFCEIIVEAGIPLFAIGGNHDEAEAEGLYNGLRFLSEHAGLGLLQTQEPLDIGDVRIHPVSYRTLSRAGRGRVEIKPFSFAENRANVLLAHGYARSGSIASLPEGADVEIPRAWLENKRFAACLLGHIHTHQEIEPGVFYAGSTERRNFGESGESPGFWIHEFNQSGLLTSESLLVGDVVPGSPREMADIEIDAKELSLRELDERVLEIFDSQEIAGVMMRIKLTGVSSEIDKRSAAQSWEREFRRREGLYFEAVVETREIAEALEVQFAGPPHDIRKGFLDFLRSSGAESDLLPLAEESLVEAQERIIAQEGD